MPVYLVDQDSESKSMKVITTGGKYNSINWYTKEDSYLGCYATTMVCLSTLKYPFYADPISARMAKMRPSMHEFFQKNRMEEGKIFWSPSDYNGLAYGVVVIPVMADQNSIPNAAWLLNGIRIFNEHKFDRDTASIGLHVPVLKEVNEFVYKSFLSAFYTIFLNSGRSIHIYGRESSIEIMEEIITGSKQLLLPSIVGDRND